jgi:hypothetical protein
MTRFAYLATVILASSGCFLAGPRDGMFRVVGTAPVDGSCYVKVSPVGSKRSGRELSVSGSFRESFVIGPSSRGHNVSLYCGQSVVSTRVVRYGRDVKFGGEVDLIEGAH